MTRGPIKKDRKLKDLQGNAGKKGKNKKLNFLPDDAEFGFPKGLSKEVREKCVQVARYLEGRGCPVKFMRPMFERYCKHSELAYKAFQKLNGTTTGKGFVVKGRKSPYATVFKENSEAALKLEMEFKRILVDTRPLEEERDELDEFLGTSGIKRVK